MEKKNDNEFTDIEYTLWMCLRVTSKTIKQTSWINVGTQQVKGFRPPKPPIKQTKIEKDEDGSYWIIISPDE